MNVTQLCKKHGIARSTVAGRMSRGGMTLEEAINAPVESQSSLRKEVEDAGLLWSTYRTRIKRGWSRERAINTPVTESELFTRKQTKERGYDQTPAHKFNMLVW